MFTPVVALAFAPGCRDGFDECVAACDNDECQQGAGRCGPIECRAALDQASEHGCQEQFRAYYACVPNLCETDPCAEELGALEKCRHCDDAGANCPPLP
jgi:hypothetical protein